MAEPNSPDSLPTQPWAGPAGTAPDSNPESPAPTPPNPRRGGWQPPEPEQLQASFPQYEIRSVLGRGGMGAVYQGWQKSLRRLVAIKILPPGLEDNGANFAERFQREAQAMARFSHPGIVSVFDAGETPDGLFYFVMEYIEGTDVQKMIKSQGPLSPEHALAITAHVCDALAYAHKRGVIHRDIKPANIMVDSEGQVKVADFGLAKMATDDSAALVTGSHVSMGTLDFMAPEALHGMSSVDHRADLYAVGVMLYQMLTGELPRGMFEMPSVHRPGVDPRFDAIVTRALQKDPEKRYASASEIRTALDKILTEPIPHRSAVQEAPPPQPAIRTELPAPLAGKAAVRVRSGGRRSARRLWLSSAIAATVVVLGGGAIYYRADPKKNETPAAAPASVHVPSLAIAPSAAGDAWQPLVSADEWRQNKDRREFKDGLLHISAHGTLVRSMPSPDGAIRTRIAFREGTETVGLTTRQGKGAGNYKFFAIGGKSVAVMYYPPDNPQQAEAIGTYSLPNPLRAGDRFSLELQLLGSELTALFNGLVVIEARDDRIKTAGDWGLYAKDGWFESVEVCSLSSSATAAASGEVHTFAGHSYQFVPGEVTWDEAKLKAERMGGHLATLGSPSEETWVLENYPTAHDVWIGGLARANAVSPEWVTGEPFGSLNWEKGHPGWRLKKTPGSANPLEGTLPAAGLVIRSQKVHIRANTARAAFLVEWDEALIPPVAATKDQPFINSLRMKFVPVRISGGPTDKQLVLFSVWETRVQDYEAFVKESGQSMSVAPFRQERDEPAINVSWEDARKFCEWLTVRERAQGRIRLAESYRLPTDHEWSCAVGLGGMEDPAATPQAKHGKISQQFPWGKAWPAPPGAVNSGDPGDGYATTARAGTFLVNTFGLYELGGNVSEWVQDWENAEQKRRTIRDFSWKDKDRATLLSSARRFDAANARSDSVGFRAVLTPADATQVPASTPAGGK